MGNDMNFINKLSEMVLESKPTQCEQCDSRIMYVKNGRYQCISCGHITLDAIGKVKTYLNNNDTKDVPKISEETDVSEAIVDMILADKEKVLIPPKSKYYLSCEKCKCSISEGRYCAFCTKELAFGIKGLFGRR